MNHYNGASLTTDIADPQRDTMPAPVPALSHEEIAELMLNAIAEEACLSVPRGGPRSPSTRPADRSVVISDRPPAQRSSLDMMVALLQERILDHTPTLPTGIPMNVFVEKHVASAPSPSLPALPDEMFMGDRAALLTCPIWLETDTRAHSKRMLWTAAAFIVVAIMAFTLLAAGGGPSDTTAPPADAEIAAR